MPKVQVRMIDPHTDHSPIWEVCVRYDADKPLKRWGKSLSDALHRLAVAVRDEERSERMRKGEYVSEG